MPSRSYNLRSSTSKAANDAEANDAENPPRSSAPKKPAVKAAGKAKTKPKEKKAEKPAPALKLPSNEELKEGIKKYGDEFLQQFSVEQISKWVTRLTGDRCEFKIKSDNNLKKLRFALRMVSIDIFCPTTNTYTQRTLLTLACDSFPPVFTSSARIGH